MEEEKEDKAEETTEEQAEEKKEEKDENNQEDRAAEKDEEKVDEKKEEMAEEKAEEKTGETAEAKADSERSETGDLEDTELQHFLELAEGNANFTETVHNKMAQARMEKWEPGEVLEFWADRLCTCPEDAELVAAMLSMRCTDSESLDAVRQLRLR